MVNILSTLSAVKTEDEDDDALMLEPEVLIEEPWFEFVSDNQFHFELPNNFVKHHSTLQPHDLAIVQQMPSILLQHIIDVIPNNFDFDELIPFFYLRTNQLQPFVLNYFLNHMVDPAPATNVNKLHKALKLINLARILFNGLNPRDYFENKVIKF